MIKRKEIDRCFPELKWITNEEIRRMIVDVWEEASNQEGWKSLDEVPFTLLFEESGLLIDHTRRVTQLAKQVTDIREESLNKDYVIAGALLHDVGKLLEYEERDGDIVKGEYGNKFRHPLSGAKIAWKKGVPDEIVHIIYAHSHEGDKIERSPEAVIVHHCDFIDFHIRRSLVEK